MEAKELVDLLYPEHDRTSCSDEDISNGFSWELDEWNDKSTRLDGRWLPRCKRCALLEITSGEVELTEENKAIIRDYVC
jgi:hypothetical protein